MELRVLRYFLAICQEKNITKAANDLHISQPSLSRQIKELEDELGVILFIRGHRQIELTEDGYYLRDRARQITTIADNTIDSLEQQKTISGVLNIGAGESPALEPVMRIISQLMHDHPQIKINLTDANADDIERRVKGGTLNFGIVMGDRPLSEFNSIILPWRNRFVAVMNQFHPLAQKEKITPADLVNFPVMLSGQSFVNDKFHGWLGNYYEHLRANLSYNLAYNGSLLTKQGQILQIVYAGLVNTGRNSELIERPLSPKITDPNIIIWKKGVHHSRLDQLFIDRIQRLVNAD